MSQSRDGQFNPSSPRSSSGGADSLKGTPDTRLTAFSPEDGSVRSAELLKDSASSASVTPPKRIHLDSSCDAADQLDKDPFVTPTNATGHSLSPTASSFRPFGSALAQPSPGPVSTTLSSDLGVTRLLALSSPAGLSSSEVDSWLSEQPITYGSRQVRAQHGLVYVQFADIRDACSVHGTLVMGNSIWKPEYIHVDQLEKVDQAPFDLTSMPVSQVFVTAIAPPGSTVDTVQAMESVRGFLESYGRLFAFVRRSTFANGSFKAIAEFCDPSAPALALSSCGHGISVAGVYLALAPYPPPDSAPSSDSTAGLSEAMGQASLGKGRFNASHEHHSPEAMTPGSGGTIDAENRVQHPLAMYPLMLGSPYAHSMPYVVDRFIPASHSGPLTPMTPIAPVSPSYSMMGSLYQTPPSPAATSQHSFSPSRPGSGLGRLDRRQNASRINRSPYHSSSGHHNHVDIRRIREGIDVRTTIMLRNIPNKVDQAMLKRIVDESSWGKYDFMYLRIDFANDCNVGYAFINFVDPLDIIDFVDARGNQRWCDPECGACRTLAVTDSECRNCFKSDKVAEISYATIQGKDCLVQKFRNSSVMLEAAHYRPKLYFTSNGPVPEMAGQEEPFPEPDNQSKMKRSCENAEHVGQNFRDEQRRRRSQYDRGTRLAALEEYDYETSLQHLYGGALQ